METRFGIRIIARCDWQSVAPIDVAPIDVIVDTFLASVMIRNVEKDRRILIVSSDEQFRCAAKRALSGLSFRTVVVASDLDEARLLARDADLAVLVVDLGSRQQDETIRFIAKMKHRHESLRCLVINDPVARKNHEIFGKKWVRLLVPPFSMYDFVTWVDRALRVARPSRRAVRTSRVNQRGFRAIGQTRSSETHQYGEPTDRDDD